MSMLIGAMMVGALESNSATAAGNLVSGGVCGVSGISYPTPDTQPHPAVARIIVPETGATAYGTGTLVDVRDDYGLVVTNWHVVSDSQGAVEVVFPSGFRSHARPLKLDSNWDLAALVIWRPPVEPVKLAVWPPGPGDRLTIHGYGQGQYRAATGRCTTYYAPRPDFPQEMVELDVEARQGDSGGPIFNQRGELAGVLFGAGQGTTLGSFAPRVSTFLATLAPDIGQSADEALETAVNPHTPDAGWRLNHWAHAKNEYPSATWYPPAATRDLPETADGPVTSVASNTDGAVVIASSASELSWDDLASAGWYDPAKSILAVVGLLAVALRLVKAVG
jgi:hypothetical protein